MSSNKCFVIMPISTPDLMLEKYRDGKDHFIHVLDCLIEPAIIKAGFDMIPPKAKGADLIQAEIVNNLEHTDLVLCDISTLNPNVFYEFGIRTSLNKPVCVIKDNLTTKIPFDTGILNHFEYDSTIEPWKLSDEIEKLSNHITETVQRCSGGNNMWKYFGMKSIAEPPRDDFSQENQYQFLMSMIEALSTKMDNLYQNKVAPEITFAERDARKEPDNAFNNFVQLRNAASSIEGDIVLGIVVLNVDVSKGGLLIHFERLNQTDNNMVQKAKTTITRKLRNMGIHVPIDYIEIPTASNI